MRLRANMRPLVAAFLLPLSVSSPVLGQDPDSVAYYGTWRWIDSTNDFSGYHGTPEACGCERLLVMTFPDSYELVEQDSAHEYVLCAGKIAVNWRLGGRAVGGQRRALWVSFEPWCLDLTGNQMIRFVGSGTDTICVRAGPGVEDASVHHFVRATATPASDSKGAQRTRLPLRDRPPRFEALWLPADSDSVYYDEAPVAIHRVQPTYPVYAREAGIQGEVTLRVLVGRDGLVRNIKVIRGVTGLNDPAYEAMKKWTFKPALSNNKPVAVWMTIPIRFRL